LQTPNTVAVQKYLPNVFTNAGVEHTVVLLLVGWELLKSAAKYMCTEPRFELLAIKWLPCLDMDQAKEATPYEIGDTLWRRSLTMLTTGKTL
jgi:hypothetical protein